jgi:choline transport protein
MVATALVNYSLGFIRTVTVISTLGSDVSELLITPLGQPWIQVLLNATESTLGTSTMIAVLCLLLLFCAVNQIATSSRQLFEFAREKGLPFSNFLAQV